MPGITPLRLAPRGTRQASARTAAQRMPYGTDELRDVHGAERVLEGGARLDRQRAERDADAADQLVDGDGAVTIAVAGACGRRRAGGGRRRDGGRRDRSTG